MTKFLMCPPNYFDVEYEINPWMDMKKKINKDLALAQWQDLYELYEDLGVKVYLIKPREGLPDMVFTANVGMAIEDKVVLSNFRYSERRGERQHFKEWFERHGYTILELPPEIKFESSGAISFYGERFLIDYGFRTSEVAVEEIEKLLNVKVIALKLVNSHFYHLDLCFTPLDTRTALYFPPAFSPKGVKVIKSIVEQPIAITVYDAMHFGCNIVVIDDIVVVNEGCKTLHGKLEEIGYEVMEVNLSEFHKSGGGARCLTLEI